MRVTLDGELIGLSNEDIKDGVLNIPEGVKTFAGSSLLILLPTAYSKIKKLILPSTLEVITTPNLSENTYFNLFGRLLELEEVYIGKELVELPDKMFYGCPKLKTVVFEEGSKLKSIGNHAFSNCKELQSITIPNSVEKIGESAFNGVAIKEIKLPTNLQVIEKHAFRNSKLEKVEFGNNISVIKEGAFADTKISKFVAPDSLKILQRQVFLNTPLKTFVANENLKELHLDNFVNLKSDETIKTIDLNKTRLLNIVGINAPANILSKITFPNSVVKIKDLYALRGEVLYLNFGPKDYAIKLNSNQTISLDTYQVEDGTLIKKLYVNKTFYLLENNKKITTYKFDSIINLEKESKGGEYLFNNDLVHRWHLFNKALLRKYGEVKYTPSIAESIAVPLNKIYEYVKNRKSVNSLVKHCQENNYTIYETKLVIQAAINMGLLHENPIIRHNTLNFFMFDLPKSKDNNSKEISTFIKEMFKNFRVNNEPNIAAAEFLRKNISRFAEIDVTENLIPFIFDNFENILKESKNPKVEDVIKYFQTKMFGNLQTYEEEQIALKLIKHKVDINQFKGYVEKFNVAKSQEIKSLAELFEEKLNITKQTQNNLENELKDKVVDAKYKYEWMRKDDVNILFNALQTHSCAHYRGIGSGLFDTLIQNKLFQEIVVKNKTKVVAKGIVYVNAEEGYMVANTFSGKELELKDLPKEERFEIIDAFIRGFKDAIKTYNKYAKENNVLPIKIATVGGSSNKLIDDVKYYLKESSFVYENKEESDYPYDSNSTQFIIYKDDEYNVSHEEAKELAFQRILKR